MIELRYRATIKGIVQGVGFRPFLHGLAVEESLSGWVCNSGSTVDLEVEGAESKLERFFRRIESEKPEPAHIEFVQRELIAVQGKKDFRIIESIHIESIHNTCDGAVLAADLTVCHRCLSEVFDPSNRRYRYPFTTCTSCGPRYTLTDSVPFDRKNTSMRDFAMCKECIKEYETPGNLRFHSQTNSCSDCGPVLELRATNGALLERADTALNLAAQALMDGKIVAVKGVGGFHLLVDGTNEDAVLRLRVRKHREAKPLALLMTHVEEAKRHCLVSPAETEMLESPAAPIVLLSMRPARNEVFTIAKSVAPGVGLLGVMIAYTPLHHLLLNLVGRPLIATSANLSDDPICFEETDAFERMRGVADLFLVHNRRILRGVDDSVVRVIGGRGVVLRRGRGYTPGTHILQPQKPNTNDATAILAFGSHLKNAIALSKPASSRIQLGPHVGTLGSIHANERYDRALLDLARDCGVSPSLAACDLHPDYVSTAKAKDSGYKILQIQHHHAHVLSCLVDNEIFPPALGVAWDGSGFGPDQTLWGGEFLTISQDYTYQRLAHLRAFRLPGAEHAVREPRRAALGLLYEMFGEKFFLEPLSSVQVEFDSVELNNYKIMLTRHLNSPVCTSAGRLFDAIAALMGVRTKCDFEGQAAMELEALAWKACGDDVQKHYSMQIVEGNDGHELDWGPLIRGILNDIQFGLPNELISARAHLAFAQGIVDVARLTDMKKVALTGGVFQNKFLTEAVICKFVEAGFQPFWHKMIPPNDGGLAVGQLLAARFKGV